MAADDTAQSNAALFLHLFFAFIFVGGTITATTLRIAALLSPSTHSIVAYLGLTRRLWPIVLASLLLTVAMGFWTVSAMSLNYKSTWLAIAYAMVGLMLLMGPVSGRMERKTREMAEKELKPLGGLEAKQTPPAADSPCSADLRQRLAAPLPWAMDVTLIASIVVTIGVMVFQPGNVKPDDAG